MNITKKMNVPIDAGLSEGWLGLTKAVDYFDFRRNVKFITYCYLVIKDHIFKYRKYGIKHPLMSNLDEGFEPFDNRHSNVETQVQNNEIKEKINNGLRFMNCRQQEIINHWFGLNGRTKLTLEQLGRKFNVTRERVRQIKTIGLGRLRELYFLQNPQEIPDATHR
jgi:RNA polymerase primary sigma factor